MNNVDLLKVITDLNDASKKGGSLIYVNDDGQFRTVAKDKNWFKRVGDRITQWRAGYKLLSKEKTADKVDKLVRSEDFRLYYRDSDVNTKNTVTQALGRLADRLSKRDVGKKEYKILRLAITSLSTITLRPASNPQPAPPQVPNPQHSQSVPSASAHVEVDEVNFETQAAERKRTNLKTQANTWFSNNVEYHNFVGKDSFISKVLARNPNYDQFEGVFNEVADSLKNLKVKNVPVKVDAWVDSHRELGLDEYERVQLKEKMINNPTRSITEEAKALVIRRNRDDIRNQGILLQLKEAISAKELVPVSSLKFTTRDVESIVPEEFYQIGSRSEFFNQVLTRVYQKLNYRDLQREKEAAKSLGVKLGLSPEAFADFNPSLEKPFWASVVDRLAVELFKPFSIDLSDDEKMNLVNNFKRFDFYQDADLSNAAVQVRTSLYSKLVPQYQSVADNHPSPVDFNIRLDEAFKKNQLDRNDYTMGRKNLSLDENRAVLKSLEDVGFVQKMKNWVDEKRASSSEPLSPSSSSDTGSESSVSTVSVTSSESSPSTTSVSSTISGWMQARASRKELEKQARVDLCEGLGVSFDTVSKKTSLLVNFFDAIVLTLLEKHSLAKSSGVSKLAKEIETQFKREELSLEERVKLINSAVNSFIIGEFEKTRADDVAQMANREDFAHYVSGSKPIPNLDAKTITIVQGGFESATIVQRPPITAKKRKKKSTAIDLGPSIVAPVTKQQVEEMRKALQL